MFIILFTDRIDFKTPEDGRNVFLHLHVVGNFEIIITHFAIHTMHLHLVCYMHKILAALLSGLLQASFFVLGKLLKFQSEYFIQFIGGDRSRSFFHSMRR